MIFFRKKKSEDTAKIKDVVEEEKVPEEIKEIADLRKIEENKLPGKVEETIPKEQTNTPEKEEIKKEFAPLFIKIDRYRSLLDSIKDLKSMILMMKNALKSQKQIERLRDENIKFLEAAIEKINKKIISLDSEFLRPRGYEEESSPSVNETETLESVVDDLDKQVEELKSQLKTIS